VISTSNIEELIPDFLLESDYFQTILLDVEGNVMCSPERLDSKYYSEGVNHFSNHLEAAFIPQFNQTIDMLLASPKQKRQLVLTFKNRKPEQVWWEFSMITNSEMDLVGIIGIGVNTTFLEQEMPWNSLVDLLEFGKIKLDQEFKILDFDQKIIRWLAMDVLGTEGKGELFLSQLPIKLNHLYSMSQPTCLVLSDEESGILFSALLTRSNSGFQLYLLPKARKSISNQIVKPFTPAHLATFPGAVWVVDESLGFVQQNQQAVDATLDWSGKSGTSSFDFIFNSEFESLNQLKNYVLSGFEGKSSGFEIKLNPVDSNPSFWYVGVRPIFDESGLIKLIAVHAIMLPKLSKRLARLETENKALKELVLAPSYILRSPLSSMLGLLDLIDQNQLDQENQKFFSYLKPLAKELDEVIRVNAKRVSALD